MKLIFYGTPRAGKTTLRKNLLGDVEGKQLAHCGTGDSEPSTNIAEICGTIFIQRIVMTGDENEWKWSVQKLDDMATALLRCVENKKLQQSTYKTTGSTQQHISSSVPQMYHKEDPNAEQVNSDKSQHSYISSASLQVASGMIIDPVHSTAQTQYKSITDSDIWHLFTMATNNGNLEEVVQMLNIDQATFLQIIDGGGQPSFQEIFPLLIGGPSVVLLIFKLTDDLYASHKVQYQPGSGSEGPKEWNDTYCVNKTISHALSSFDAKKILIVGTHKDKLEVSQVDKESRKNAAIQKISDELLGWLRQSKASKSLVAKRESDLLISISKDNTDDIRLLKKQIEQAIFQSDFTEIPAPLLMFDFLLHKYAEQNQMRKLEKSVCQKIASSCGIKEAEIDVALDYLHLNAGTLLYYSDIHELKQYVITDFQLILDSISKIIIQYFDPNSANGACLSDKLSFKSNGLLDASALPRDVPPDYLNVKELLSLLKHRHIISEKVGENLFFMPSVLPNADYSHDLLSNSSSFLVLFDDGYCPVGLFCAATTELLVAHNWELNTGVQQYRNRINFYCSCPRKSYKVIFSAFPTHYEACLMPAYDGEILKDITDEELLEVKHMIYSNINDTITNIGKHYSNKKDCCTTSPSYGFYCPKRGTCRNTYQHPAKCIKAEREIECKYSGARTMLNKEQKQWFPQVNRRLYYIFIILECELFLPKLINNTCTWMH